MPAVFHLINLYNLSDRVFFTGVKEEFVEAIRTAIGLMSKPYKHIGVFVFTSNKNTPLPQQGSRNVSLSESFFPFNIYFTTSRFV